MGRLAIAVAAAFILLAGQASATTYLRYDFIAQSSFDGLFHGSFTAFFLTNDTPPPAGPTTTTSLTGAQLPLCITSRDGDTNACWAAKLLPDAITYMDYDLNSEVSGDEVELWYKPTPAPGDPPISDADCADGAAGCQTYAYIFQQGALSTPGRYLSVGRDPIPGGLGPGQYADELGILRVSVATSTDATFTDVGGVPEPGVWSLLIAGFAAVGAALRAHRRRFIRA